MIVRPQNVQIIKLSKDMKKWYQYKGYDISKKPLIVVVDDLQQKSNLEVYFECDYCGDQNGKRSYKRLMLKKHHFCSPKTGRDCVKLFKQAEREEKLIHLLCEYCGESYTRTPYQYENHGSRFCNKACRNKWESSNKRGENHHNYSRVDMPCAYCKTLHPVKKYKVESDQKNFFCDEGCRRAWYSEVWSQSDEWREESRKRAARQRKEGRFKKKGDNKPESVIIKLLHDLEIVNEPKKTIGYYESDNYLTNYNLSIEVNGTYWHCDPRKYKAVIYEEQAKRIVTDFDKEEFLEKEHEIKTLYLWEMDIKNDLEMCESLIQEFIKNRGNISSYHSFNYGIKNAELKIVNDLQPYKDTSNFEIIKPKKNKGYIISHRSELDERQVLEALVLINKLDLSAKELESCLDMKPKIAQGLVHRPTSYMYARETYMNMSPEEKRILFIETIQDYDIIHKTFKSAQALSAKDVFAILDLLEEGAPINHISQKFNFGSSSVKKIKDKKIYKSIIRLYHIIKDEYPSISKKY